MEETTEAGQAGHPSASLGARLQTRREEQGLTLADVESRLRIRRTILQAIEGERYSELPDKVYALGFIKSYARFLGLDTGEIMEQANSELASLVPKRQTVQLDLPGPQAERSAGLWVLLAIGLVVIIGGYVGWYHFYEHGRLGASIFPSHLAEKMAAEKGDASQPLNSAPAPVAPAQPQDSQPGGTQENAAHAVEPARQAAPAKPAEGQEGQKDMPDLPPPPEAVSPAADGTSSAAGREQEAQPQDHQDEGHGVEPARSAQPVTAAPAQAANPSATQDVHKGEVGKAPVVQAPVPAPVSPSQPATTSAAAAPVPGREAGNAAANVAGSAKATGDVVRIHALEDSWVHVVDASGKSLIGHVLKKGDIWQGDPGATYHVTSGNAGGVVLQAGNVVSAPLGLRGKIAHDVVVNAALVEQGHYGHGSLSAGIAPARAHR